jgi:elongation factor Ts
MSISAQSVKELRDKTAAGMMDCKKALEETGGDMEKAVDWLRQKGLAKAARRSGRTTSEGLIGCHVAPDGKHAVLLELRCETDFVSRGDTFQEMVRTCTGDFFASGSDTIDAEATLASLGDAVAVLGENITIGQSARMRLSGHGGIGTYVHSNGKIAVLVELGCSRAGTAEQAAFSELARNLAMQVAAAAPLAVSAENIDDALIAREREVYRQKARDDGKPDHLVDRIAEGAIKKYFTEVCLLEQAYIRDDKTRVADLIRQVGREVDDALSVRGFVRIQIGAE